MIFWPRKTLAALLPALFLMLPQAAPAQSQRDWTKDDAALLFYEAATAIGDTALDPPPALEMARRAIVQMVHGVDQWSEYLTPDEYKAFKASQDNSFAGVGMDIERTRDGRVLCFPFEDSPAMKGGVRPGDQLLSVGGDKVEGQSLFLLGARIRGKEGSTIILTVKTGNGGIRRVVLTRGQVQYKSVTLSRKSPLPVLRISRFTPGTAKELALALRATARASVRVIDLRGNSGGDLQSAIKAANLFLAKGAPITTLETRDKKQQYLSENDAQNGGDLVFLWQDEATASAAEVFIAALRDNKRARTIGRRSFGKGVAQRLVVFSDGSAMFITYGRLVAPSGQTWQEKGLEPMHALPVSEDGDDTLYMAEVSRLLKKALSERRVPK